MRFYKSIGLGFKTPKAAIEGNYVDKKCPFTGNVSIRGRILKAMVISNKMKRTLVVRRDYLQYFSKYRRFAKKHKNMSVHCTPAFQNVGEGDIVTIGQCRPLAKTVRFNVIEHFPAVNKVCRHNPAISPYVVISLTHLFPFYRPLTSRRSSASSKLVACCNVLIL
jgi:small subunit ribosomal protein S11e